MPLLGRRPRAAGGVPRHLALVPRPFPIGLTLGPRPVRNDVLGGQASLAYTQPATLFQPRQPTPHGPPRGDKPPRVLASRGTSTTSRHRATMPFRSGPGRLVPLRHPGHSRTPINLRSALRAPLCSLLRSPPRSSRRYSLRYPLRSPLLQLCTVLLASTSHLEFPQLGHLNDVAPHRATTPS